MFSIGQSTTHEKYPNRSDIPSLLFHFDREIGVMIDADKPVNPHKTTCDAYVLTQKGVHLFWLYPNKPTKEEAELGDPLHDNLNEEKYPIFFADKDTKRQRSCVPLTQRGWGLALEYNRKANEIFELARAGRVVL